MKICSRWLRRDLHDMLICIYVGQDVLLLVSLPCACSDMMIVVVLYVSETTCGRLPGHRVGIVMLIDVSCVMRLLAG